MKQETRKCMECGETIKGRADKKFCDDQCRSYFNNRINSEVSSEMRHINSRLRRNRRVLQMLTRGKETVKVATDSLYEAGFSFRYHTQLVDLKGRECRLCYDYGYVRLDQDEYMLIQWTDDAKQKMAVN